MELPVIMQRLKQTFARRHNALTGHYLGGSVLVGYPGGVSRPLSRSIRKPKAAGATEGVPSARGLGALSPRCTADVGAEAALGAGAENGVRPCK
jgi:hypothetical protein